MTEKRATRRDRSHGRAKKSTEQVDGQSIARRTEQGGWAMGVAVAVSLGVPMLLRGLGI